MFSKANPGVVYVVPTRYETKAAFKIGHTSRHMRLKHGIVKKRKVRSDKGKKMTFTRATRSDKGGKHKMKPTKMNDSEMLNPWVSTK